MSFNSGSFSSSSSSIIEFSSKRFSTVILERISFVPTLNSIFFKVTSIQNAL